MTYLCVDATHSRVNEVHLVVDGAHLTANQTRSRVNETRACMKTTRSSAKLTRAHVKTTRSSESQIAFPKIPMGFHPSVQGFEAALGHPSNNINREPREIHEQEIPGCHFAYLAYFALNPTHASGPGRFLGRLFSHPNAKYSPGRIIIRQQAVPELMPMTVSSLRW